MREPAVVGIAARAEVVLHRDRHAEQRPIRGGGMLGVERRRPRQHPRRIDVQERAEAAAGAVSAVEAGDARQERLRDLGRRRVLAENRLAGLPRGPVVDRAADPDHLRDAEQARPRTASGALRSASSRLSDGLGSSGRSVGQSSWTCEVGSMPEVSMAPICST